MDKDWIKALIQLCTIVRNNVVSEGAAVRYLEIMSDKYGLDEKSFRQVYDDWYRSGEITETYGCGAKRERSFLYHRGVDGMCRMLDEKIIDEKLFLETLWETPYQILREGKEYIGYYAELPGCIGSAANEEELKTEMQAILKKWIRTAAGIWRENKILEE